MNRVQVRTIITVAWLALAAAAVRLIFGADAGWVVLAAGLLILLGYHARNLGRLLEWLSRPDPGAVPGTVGIWDDAFAFLHRRERRHKQKRKRLRRLVVRYGQAGRALPDGVIVLDAENRIEWCNEKAESRFGIDGQADVGQPITNLVRQPEFVEYVATGDYSHPIQLL